MTNRLFSSIIFFIVLKFYTVLTTIFIILTMEAVIDKMELFACKELVNKRFTFSDIDYCLSILSYITAKRQKKSFWSQLFHIPSKKKLEKKTILDRGISQGYCITSVNEAFVRSLNLTISLRPEDNYTELKNTINMKQLYFHKGLKNITEWILSRHNFFILPSVYLNFVLPSKFYKFLYKPKGHETAKRCLLLRCTKITRNSNEISQENCYPLSMKLYINEQDFTHLLPRKVYCSNEDIEYYLPIPTMLNEAILKFPEVCAGNDFVNVGLSYRRSNNKNDIYAFAIFTSTIRSVEEVCQEIRDKEKVTLKKFEEDLKKFMSSSEDITLNSVVISLHSSITSKRIKVPFRGKHCNHIIPDDLEDYVRININNENWLCKICKNQCTPDDIMIDEFYTNILDKYPTVEQIELYPGLKYKLFDGNKTLVNNSFEIRGTNGTKRTNVKDTLVLDIKNDDRQKKLSHYDTSIANEVLSIISTSSSDNEPLQRRSEFSDISCLIPPVSTFKNIAAEKVKSKNNTMQKVINNWKNKVNNSPSPNIERLSNIFESNSMVNTDNSLCCSIEQSVTNVRKETIDILREHINKNCPVFKEIIREVISRNIKNINNNSQERSFVSDKPDYISNNLWDALNNITIASLFVDG